MTSYELYTKDARVWIPHSENVWEGAVVTQPFKKGDELIYLKTDNNNVTKEIKIKGDNDLPHLRNPPILIGQNDLTALSYLHEPDVLYNLQVRFCERQAIYTYCGIVLVAINPYAELPLYGQDMIQAYRGHSMGELEPHIFAIAEDAYTKLEREKCDLSIIVSGESGAGKTVSAKYAMRYFAAVGGSESETQIERKVLASSPIMEAIGNAKTTRNDNSSRFGKFTKLLFTSEMSLMSLTGATMQTYLLEKSRVVFQAPGERNYHIFYQLCAARDQWPELMLDHQNNFRYLNQGESPDIAKISDLEQFTETISALTTLGFTDDEIKDIVKILAGILHLGNIQFTFKHKEGTGEIDQEESETAPNDLHLGILSELLQLDYSDLKKWLTIRQIESVNELVYIPINRETAEAARDALGKHIYAKLFQYIVEIINKSLITGKKQHGFIGVLDIYGFETFDINSFEQFCINYANEKLQQQFNQHVFKLEQEEYLKEGIVWTMIDFYDNQPCIDLIETKLGILDLLDEECRMPRGSDESWAGKLMEKCTKYQHFEKPRFGNTAFLVKHFSDTVKYEVQGFLEKNRDTVSKELVNVLRESGMPLCRKLMDLTDGIDNVTRDTKSPSVKVVISASKVQATPSKQHKQTVGSQFRESLSLLINTLHSTTPHYVRCIKPNEDKYAFKWEPSKIVQQLRACGVLETVRISAAGFPSRWSYDDFYARYRLLCKRAQIVDWNVKATCVNIVRNLIKDEDKFRYGNTQIFFRAGQVAFLEQIRSDLRKKYIIVIQSLVRRFIYHRRYMKLKKSVLGIQRYARGLMARRKAEKMRRNRAAITLQRHIRGWLCRQRFLKIRQSILGIQTYARGLLARRTFKVVLDNYKAIQIQRYCRGYLARLEFQKKKQMIIKCQAAIRKFLARRLFKRMKTEARTVAHIQKMYKGLENKIISMQQKMDEVNKENAALKVKTAEIPELRSKVDVMKNMENELKSLRAEVKQKDELLIIKSKELVKEQDEKMSLLEEKHKAELEHAQQKMILEKENEELSKQLSELMEKANKEAIVTSRLARQLSEADVNELHQAYQKTITEKESLEKLNYILKEEVNRLNKLIQNSKSYITHSRSISNASSQNDEDFGYSSAKNTLELKREFTSTPNHVPDLDKNDKMDFVSYGHNITPDSMEKTTNSEVITVVTSPTSGNNPTALILRLRKLLEEEKNRSESLQRRITRIENKNKSTMSTVDSIKMSELEVENEKIRQDYQLLRNSIKRGVEHQEMEAQYLSIQEELKRRRDECIQLRAVLANQSQSLRSLGSTQFRNDTDRLHDSSELMEAFQAQKLVNRQLESELTALTVENNAKIEELNHLIDDLRNERNKFQTILEDKLNVDHSENNPNNIIKKQSEIYLRHELEKTMTDYVSLQEKMNEMVKKLNELMKINNILTNRLRDHGLNDSIILNEEMQNMVTVKKKAQVYQGIFKYRHEDESKILQRLINDFKPRVAITLLPGLPAYIVFMCIRYTDLVNTDQHVRTLLTNFVIQVKKLYKLPKPTDYRVLWMVNTLKLNNLLKQYGGIDEFINLNTETQNQQQLKNFDLSEYRQVIYETIINIYFMLVRQIQELIKGYIVPAILDHDEMARGKGNRGRAMSLDMPPSDQQNISLTEPKSLVNQLEHYYKQLQYFGLDDCYIEQIIKQLMYYICTISMNNLMLRQELCMWKTGMKIRYNVGCLEEWVRKNKMSGEVVKPLQPLIEVSSLLQSRKSEEDVQSIYELCPSLTTAQVLKIIKSYTLDDYENAIKPIFIEKLTHKLNERQQSTGNDTFTMDENFVHPLNVVYKYSEIKLEDIELPSILNLDGLLTKI